MKDKKEKGYKAQWNPKENTGRIDLRVPLQYFIALTLDSNPTALHQYLWMPLRIPSITADCPIWRLQRQLLNVCLLE